MGRRLTIDELAERGKKVARLRAALREEDQDFENQKNAHKTTVAGMEGQIAKLENELLTGESADEQLELPMAGGPTITDLERVVDEFRGEPVPADDEQGEETR